MLIALLALAVVVALTTGFALRSLRRKGTWVALGDRWTTPSHVEDPKGKDAA